MGAEVTHAGERLIAAAKNETERLRRETATDRVVAYFEGILGRPLTRAEKIPIPAILAGDTEGLS